MSYIYNRVDLALKSTGPTEVVDITEKGGIEHAQLVVELAGGGSVTIEGADKEGGTFVAVTIVTVPADGVYRERIPLECPRFIRLSAASGATLTVRV
jgi:hypothetical protein